MTYQYITVSPLPYQLKCHFGTQFSKLSCMFSSLSQFGGILNAQVSKKVLSTNFILGTALEILIQVVYLNGKDKSADNI